MNTQLTRRASEPRRVRIALARMYDVRRLACESRTSAMHAIDRAIRPDVRAQLQLAWHHQCGRVEALDEAIALLEAN